MQGIFLRACLRDWGLQSAAVSAGITVSIAPSLEGWYV